MPLPLHLINEDLEKAVLGRILDEPNLLGSLPLATEDFVIGKHKLILASMQNITAGGTPLTLPLLGADLHNSALLEDMGGVVFLASLREYRIQAHDYEHAVKRLTDLATMRRALQDAYAITAKLEMSGSTVADIAEFGTLAEMATLRSKRGVRLRTVTTVIKEFPGGIDAFMSPVRGQKHVRFPWTAAQERIGGLWPGELMVLGGRPASGKSAAALQLARFNAGRGIITAIFNLEMTDIQTIHRAMCSRAGITMSHFRQANLTKDERRRLMIELRAFAEEGILLCDRPTLTIGEIRSAARRSVEHDGVGLVIVDYLQLADAGIRTDRRDQEVSFISRNCKLMGMESNVPVIALAQLSRKSEDQHREPILSDLRESGSIEQDSDVVMFTHRKSDTSEQGRHDYKLLFRKVRNGPDGSCSVFWDASKLEFRDLETRAEEGRDE